MLVQNIEEAANCVNIFFKSIHLCKCIVCTKGVARFFKPQSFLFSSFSQRFRVQQAASKSCTLPVQQQMTDRHTDRQTEPDISIKEWILRQMVKNCVCKNATVFTNKYSLTPYKVTICLSVLAFTVCFPLHGQRSRYCIFNFVFLYI